MSKFNAVVLLLSDTRGVYIPQNFTECCDMDEWHVSEKDVEYLSNIDNSWYWEAWNDVLEQAYYIDAEGNKFTLYQDGDLWAICFERMTKDEKESFGFDCD